MTSKSIVKRAWISVACYLSDYTRKKIRDSVENDTKELTISIPINRDPNCTIDMTELQLEQLNSNKDGGSVRVTILLSQMKTLKKLSKTDIVSEALPPMPDWNTLSIIQLATIFDAVNTALKRKLEVVVQVHPPLPKSETMPIVSILDDPCSVSYNETLYCPTCKKKTDNGDCTLVDNGKNHTLTSACTQCNNKKTRIVNMKKEVDSGRISFL